MKMLMDNLYIHVYGQGGHLGYVIPTRCEKRMFPQTDGLKGEDVANFKSLHQIQ